MVSVLDSLKVSIANKQIVLSLYIDFKKAFDLINPNILFLKLFHYGFDNCSLNLFKNYFTDRSQATKIKGRCSPSSVISPFYFSNYINEVVFSLCLSLFADDTTINGSGYELFKLIIEFKIKLNPLLNRISFNQWTIN